MKLVYIIVLLCLVLIACDVKVADFKEYNSLTPSCQIDLPEQLTLTVTFWNNTGRGQPDTSLISMPKIQGWDARNYGIGFPCTWGKKTRENVNHIYCRKIELSRQPVSPEGIVGELEKHRVKIELAPIPKANYVTSDPDGPKFLEKYNMPVKVVGIQCGWDE